jgi:heme/copper-type cytochrome/quinol oxidase subunit 2
MKYNFNILILSFIIAFLSVSLAFGADKESEPVVIQPSSDGLQRLNVTVDSYSFSPDHIIVSVNKPVEFTLKSVSKIVPHNFTLRDREAGLNVDENISPGKEVEVSFTPTKTGSYQFYCNKNNVFANHRKKGMERTLEVRQ